MDQKEERTYEVTVKGDKITIKPISPEAELKAFIAVALFLIGFVLVLYASSSVALAFHSFATAHWEHFFQYAVWVAVGIASVIIICIGASEKAPSSKTSCIKFVVLSIVFCAILSVLILIAKGPFENDTEGVPIMWVIFWIAHLIYAVIGRFIVLKESEAANYSPFKTVFSISCVTSVFYCVMISAIAVMSEYLRSPDSAVGSCFDHFTCIVAIILNIVVMYVSRKPLSKALCKKPVTGNAG